MPKCWRWRRALVAHSDDTGCSPATTSVVDLNLVRSGRWFEAGEIWGDGDPALTPIAKQLSSLVQETVEPNQPDVSLDMDLIAMGRSKI